MAPVRERGWRVELGRPVVPHVGRVHWRGRQVEAVVIEVLPKVGVTEVLEVRGEDHGFVERHLGMGGGVVVVIFLDLRCLILGTVEPRGLMVVVGWSRGGVGRC